MNLDELNFNFSFDEEPSAPGDDTTYTNVVNIPQYVPSGEKPDVDELIEMTKVNELLENIEESDVPDDVKEFLRIAAYRHAVIDFDKVADYYAESQKEIQELMEQSALVIIDVDNAIANGYTQLQRELDDIMGDEDDE